jgi:hypothetical protein
MRYKRDGLYLLQIASHDTIGDLIMNRIVYQLLSAGETVHGVMNPKLYYSHKHFSLPTRRSFIRDEGLFFQWNL